MGSCSSLPCVSRGSVAPAHEAEAWCSQDITIRESHHSIVDYQVLLSQVDVSTLLKSGEISRFAALWCNAAAAKRMLVATEGDMALATRKMVHALKWRTQQQQLLEGASPLASDIRCVGLDASGCAVVYTCCANQTMYFSSCIDLAISELERTCTLLDLTAPGGQIVYVYDVFGFLLRLNLNPSALFRLVAPADSYFAERIAKIIVVDLPSAAQFILNAVLPRVPTKTREKILVCQQEECLQLLAERCQGGGDGVRTLERVKQAMSLNRQTESSVESRRALWNGTTWKGEPLPKTDTSSGPESYYGDLIATVTRMETARAARNYESRLDVARCSPSRHATETKTSHSVQHPHGQVADLRDQYSGWTCAFFCEMGCTSVVLGCFFFCVLFTASSRNYDLLVD